MRGLRSCRRYLSGKHWCFLGCAFLTALAFSLASSSSAHAGKLWKLFELPDSGIRPTPPFQKFAVNAHGDFVQAKIVPVDGQRLTVGQWFRHERPVDERFELLAVVYGADGRLLSTIRTQLPHSTEHRKRRDHASFLPPCHKLTALLLTPRHEIVFARGDCCALFKVDANSHVRRIVGTGVEGSTDGPSEQAEIGFVDALTLDSENNVVFSEIRERVSPKATPRTRIRKLTPTGSVITIAGFDSGGYVDGPLGEARFDHVFGLATTPAGDIFGADGLNNRIRKLLIKEGRVVTVAGCGRPGWRDGKALRAGVSFPTCVTTTASGETYFTSRVGIGTTPQAHLVRRLDKNGKFVETILRDERSGETRPQFPQDAIWPLDPKEAKLTITSIAATPDGGLLMNADEMFSDFDFPFYFLAPDDDLDRRLTQYVAVALGDGAQAEAAREELTLLAQRPGASQTAQLLNGLRRDNLDESFFKLLPAELIGELSRYLPSDTEILRCKMAVQAVAAGRLLLHARSQSLVPSPPQSQSNDPVVEPQTASSHPPSDRPVAAESESQTEEHRLSPATTSSPTSHRSSNSEHGRISSNEDDRQPKRVKVEVDKAEMEVDKPQEQREINEDGTGLR